MEIPITFEGNKPERKTDGAAGYDLKSDETKTIQPNEFVVVSTGTKIQMPREYYGVLHNRSSNGMRQLVMTTGAGVIDSDYTGTIFCCFRNLSPVPIMITKGERIAQIVIMKWEKVNFIPVFSEGELQKTERGDGGFGSTGKK